jgi:predicted metal-dependent phosphoesterase TrpH
MEELHYGDLHIHSCYSFDSTMEPKTIVLRAQKAKMNLIAITDHGTIEGALETRKKATNQFGVEVIIGEEIGTDIGDIIGLNLTETIPSGRHMKWRDVLSEINRQGGISVLPHPYRDHRGDIYPVAIEVDIIEGWNARCSMEENQKAITLVRETMKPSIVSSDAHFPSEIGNARSMIEFSSSWNPVFCLPIWITPSSRINTYRSHAVKFLKKKGIISSR